MFFRIMFAVTTLFRTIFTIFHVLIRFFKYVWPSIYESNQILMMPQTILVKPINYVHWIRTYTPLNEGKIE